MVLSILSSMGVHDAVSDSDSDCAPFNDPDPAPFAAAGDNVHVDADGVKAFSYPSMSKTRGGFRLDVADAKFTDSQIILLHGQPRTGKTTFINLLARHVYPDTIQGAIPFLSVSYKPQHIIPNKYLSVRALFQTLKCSSFNDPRFFSTVTKPLKVLPLMDKLMTHLSDSELQRVGLCFCLARDADIYLIDEPTARLNQVERKDASRVIKRFIQRTKRTALVIEHNLKVASYLADRVIVFEGTPSGSCVAHPPTDRSEVFPM